MALKKTTQPPNQEELEKLYIEQEKGIRRKGLWIEKRINLLKRTDGSKKGIGF